jgi:transposase-like protein
MLSIFMDMANIPNPRTLQEAVEYFSDADRCQDYVVSRVWPNGVVCPTCGGKDVRYYQSVRRWECKNKHPRRQFSAKNGTVFTDSPLGLDKWLIAMWLVVNCKNGVSSYEIARALGITQKSAWFVNHRIRLALQAGHFDKLSGEIEADEAFIGGKARNLHLSERKRRITGTGGKDKAAVMGILQRGGKVRTTVIPNRKKAALHSDVRKHVEAGLALYTDALLSYDGVESDYAHQVIDHAVQHVDGRVHTNGLENFWALLKRGISGTYVSVEPFHLFRYLDEQTFRYNNRKREDGSNATDAERFNLAVSQLIGKKLPMLNWRAR